MKIAVLKGKTSHIAIEEKEYKPLKGDIDLKIKYCGICGSDIAYYKQIRPIENDLVLGHEFCGIYNNTLYTIIPETKHGFIGTNIDGGMRESIWINKKQLFNTNKLKNNPQLATLIEPIACVMHSLNKYKHLLENKKIIGIIGDGFIGNVIKIALEKKYNVEVLSRNSLVEDNKYELIFECSGSFDGFNRALHSIKNNGIIIQLGHLRNNQLKNSNIDIDFILRKEIQVVGSWRSDFNEDWKLAYEFIQKHKWECLGLIDKIYTLKDANKAFEEKIKKSYKKVIIKI